MLFHESQVDCIFPRPICWILSYSTNSICIDSFAEMTGGGSIDLGKSWVNLQKKIESNFHQMYSSNNILCGASGWDDYQTKLEIPYCIYFMQGKMFRAAKPNISGITAGEGICSFFQTWSEFRESRVIVASLWSLGVYLYVIGTVNISWSIWDANCMHLLRKKSLKTNNKPLDRLSFLPVSILHAACPVRHECHL